MRKLQHQVGSIRSFFRALRGGVMLVAGGILALQSSAADAENASNPLAAANNVDLRWQFTEGSTVDVHDAFLDGAYMLLPTLKLKYEVHYNWTDRGRGYNGDWERLNVKPIWFPYQTKLSESWGLRAAVGAELIIDLGSDKTPRFIPSGTNQFAPLAGVAFANTDLGLTLVPLVQHFVDIGPGMDVNQTAFRLIAIQPFADAWWGKLDAKAPFDWENDTIPATAEMQIGYNFNERWAAYADGLVGIGNDRPYDFGVGLGARFKY